MYHGGHQPDGSLVRDDAVGPPVAQDAGDAVHGVSAMDTDIPVAMEFGVMQNAAQKVARGLLAQIHLHENARCK